MESLNSKLLEKSFDLKKSNVYGGRQDTTFKECSTNTKASGCTDVAHQTSDDNGKVLSTCTDYNCP